HERIRHRADEELAQRFLEHRRSERPEALTELDPRVDDVAHVRPPRVGDDAAVAEGTGTPFHAALEPADDAAVGDLHRGPLVERLRTAPLAAQAPSLVDRGTLRLERVGNRAIVERRSPVAVAHDEAARPAAGRVPGVVRGAQRGAVVAGSRLDEDVAEA